MPASPLQIDEVIQYESTDCGAACIKSILKFYGVEENIERIKWTSGTNKNGTTFLGIKESFESYGLICSGYEGGIEDLQNLKSPAILHFTIENSYNHYVVLAGFDDIGYVIMDPMYGLQRLKENDLEKCWVSKRFLLIEEGNKLEKGIESSSNTMNWFVHILREHLGKLLIALFLGVILSGLGLITAIFIEELVDRFISLGKIESSINLCFMWFLLLLIQELLSFLRMRIIITQSYEFSIELAKEYFLGIFRLDSKYFENTKVGDLISRLDDAEVIDDSTTKIIGSVAIDFAILIIVSTYLFFVSVYIGFIVTGSLCLFLGISYLMNGPLVRHQREMVIAHSKRESLFVDILESANVIKAYSVTERYLGKMNKYFAKLEDKRLDLGNHLNLYQFLIRISEIFIISTTLLYVVLGVFKGTFQPGTIFSIYLLVGQVSGAISRIVMLNIDFQGAAIAIKRLGDFAAISSEIKEIKGTTLQPDGLKGSLVLEDISFKFPGDMPLINKADLFFASESITCLVGSNGTGKSTLLKLIKGIYLPDTGNITIGNSVVLKKEIIEQWNDLVGYVEQVPRIIDGTVYENLSFGKIEHNEIRTFLERYGFDTFINHLPDGLDTVVGNGGFQLSGGQKHLISIIRGLLNPCKILLLDEPLVSLDESYQKLLIFCLMVLKNDKTIIVSSHSEQILRIADEVYKFPLL